MTQDTIRKQFDAWLKRQAVTQEECPSLFEAYQAACAELLPVIREMRQSLAAALFEVDGCELNMSNYRHDDVHGLNNAYVALFQYVEEAITKADTLLINLNEK